MKIRDLNYFKPEFWDFTFIFLFSLSSSILAAAFWIDKILGFDPCILCIYQRIPYVLIALVSIFAFKYSAYRKLSLKLISTALVVGAAIAVYHTGVEKHWWDSAFQCSPNLDLSPELTYSEFLQNLNNAPISDCSKAAIKIAAFSLAEINVIFSFLLLALTTNMIKLYAKTKF